jgi:hypothetical protein
MSILLGGVTSMKPGKRTTGKTVGTVVTPNMDMLYGPIPRAERPVPLMTRAKWRVLPVAEGNLKTVLCWFLGHRWTYGHVTDNWSSPQRECLRCERVEIPP